jgi:predicted site-specific integrase-resolvase
MNDDTTHGGKHTDMDSQVGVWPEKMKISQAAKFLGVSFSTMSNLIGSGKIKYKSDVLDRRIKLVKRSDLEELMRKRNGG